MTNNKSIKINKKLDFSPIIKKSTPKNIEYLNLVLAGFERQSENDFEIIIADDGSDENVIKQIEELSTEFPFRVIHIWQEDKDLERIKF